MKSILLKPVKYLNVLIICLLVCGCTFERETAFNRYMQNVTAHYNILFNANEILRQKQEAYANAYPDNYSQILSVYPDTTAKTTQPDKELESVVLKGNKIISDKVQSRYIGDAYLVIGKANFLEGNYFNATEFFSYVVRSFPKNKNLTQDALVWKARALMHNNEYSLADSVLDTAMTNIFAKQQNIADVYAARLQYDIYAENYVEAEAMAKKAVLYSHDVNHRQRWTFILAQVQELNRKTTDAFNNYTSVMNSNAQFEMSFNASLNRIRIQGAEGGQKVNRIALLRKLLKQDKNADFIDQIYYQIAEQYLAQNNINQAIVNYNLSVRNSTKNADQKGLSYLRLAEINFKNKADYGTAKKYYDSTLSSLSPTYPGYQTIRKKSNNLQLLADRLQIISREDTLQMLAKLDEAARAAKATDIAKRQYAAQQTASAAGNTNNGSANYAGYGQPSRTAAGNGVSNNFYFNNASAVTQGYSDFKRIWGNRPLADNWRISAKASTPGSNAQAAAQQGAGNAAAGSQAKKSPADQAIEKIQQDLLQNTPLTAAQLAQSNYKMYNAWLDIANFYRDILDDKKEAIATYEMLLKRFPGSVNKSVLYYNLYRLYSDIDPAKSETYKNLILKDYPETDFAKVILDPQYVQKLNDRNAAFTEFYTKVFDLIAARKYTEAATKADELVSLYPANNFMAQAYYLRAVALGHQQKLDPFKAELEDILQKFPDDKLIAPLVKQHLAYIDEHKDEMAARPVVLVDTDPNEVPFMQQHDRFDAVTVHPNNPVAGKMQPVTVKPTTQLPKLNAPKPPKADSLAMVKPKVQPQPKTDSVAKVKPQLPSAQTDSTAKLNATIKPSVKTDSLGKLSTQGPVKIDSVAKVPTVEAPSIFSLKDSTNYYFVVNVNTNRTNLAPSRFGIGQFNRANFQNNNIKHQLKVVGANQLIYVGRFNSLSAVRAYARALVPLLPEIMNVPADKYSFFIITQENLDKLADKTTLDNYYDFYQKKY